MKKTGQPDKVLKALIDGNEIYRNKCEVFFDQLKDGQTPEVGLITCGDSRVPSSIFGIDALNNIFIVKNIGNQIRNSEGSIKYPILHLHTPIFIVLGHTGCGAIFAATGDYTKEDDAIQHELVSLKNSIRRAEHHLKGREPNDKIKHNSMISEINVDHQISKMLVDYSIKPLVESGKLTIIGMMFDIHNVYDKGCAHIYITNVNGEIDVEKIRKHKVLAQLDDNEIKDFVKRLT